MDDLEVVFQAFQADLLSSPMVLTAFGLKRDHGVLTLPNRKQIQEDEIISVRAENRVLTVRTHLPKQEKRVTALPIKVYTIEISQDWHVGYAVSIKYEKDDSSSTLPDIGSW